MSNHLNYEQQKETTVKIKCENGNWEPVCYDEYNSISGEWSFKVCSEKDATHLRHTNTGKMYRWNQSKRIIRHDIDFYLGRIH